MFKPKTDTSLPKQAAARGKAVVPTIISAGMVVEGNLRTTGDVQVEGRVIGEIYAAQLVVAESGEVSGNITAETARICGQITGAVTGGTITLTATARVIGDVLHDVLAIEAGGLLEGLSRRRAAPPALTAPAQTSATIEGKAEKLPEPA
ncbi:polymer-forming cytoskeletal protein [Acidocella sp.]|uniref:bactofilin family protein n=1 Tax=Acidocella sp. TaxID=50710 RepID=UPI00260C0613|nr:polymer-forming cytoskeletal protein [Acidocella sp.]